MRYLILFSVSYLSFPYVIFSIGWLKWYWAIFCVALIAAAIGDTARIVRHIEYADVEDAAGSRPLFRPRDALPMALIGLAWIGLAGMGGYGLQSSDWRKHNAVLQYLIAHPWPAASDLYATAVPLVYYIAFYLPAALVGKVGGWILANHVLFVWGVLGLSSAVLWFCVLVGRISLLSLLIFIAFSGLDAIGKTLVSWVGWSDFPWSDWQSLEWWAGHGFMQYSANTTLLYWAPNQALAGWIASGIVLYSAFYSRHRRLTLFVWGLSALWSPFVTLGLLLYVAVDFLLNDSPWSARLKHYVSLANISGLVLLLLTTGYYTSKLYEILPFVSNDIPRGFFLTDAEPVANQIALLLAFWLIELGIYLPFVYKCLPYESKSIRTWFVVTAACLAVLPLYRLGIWNDLVMRASIPSLFFLAVYVARALHHRALSRLLRLALAGALAVGATTGVLEIRYHIADLLKRGTLVQVPAEGEITDLVVLFQSLPSHLAQYMGSSASPFFRYVAREPEAQRTSSSEPRRYISFDHKIAFVGYELNLNPEPGADARVMPGKAVQAIFNLHVYFTTITTNYNFAARVVAEDGTELWKEQGWPQNRPTSAWAPTINWFDTRTIAIPSDAAPGLYRIEIAIVHPETQEVLPAYAFPSGEPLGEFVPVGYLVIGELDLAPMQPLRDAAQLGDKVIVVGTSLAPEVELSRGDSLHVTLYWQTIGPMDRDYTGFVHLLDPNGNLVAQQDHQPRNGFVPTSLWRIGFVVADDYHIDLPPDIETGTYSLVAGMYDRKSGARLPLLQDGRRSGDTVRLAAVHVH